MFLLTVRIYLICLLNKGGIEIIKEMLQEKLLYRKSGRSNLLKGVNWFPLNK